MIALETRVERAKEGDRGALSEVIGAVKDDVFRLALRMLGLRAEAEDATQEVLIQVLTHLSTFRGESRFRTWVWRIAARHLLRVKKSRREEVASFETIEMLIAKGDEGPPVPSLSEAELRVLTEEVRLSCTEAMVLSLDRDQRISWILAEIFELSGDEAARILDLEPAAHRKRLSRARERLGEWMSRKCGLVDEANRCRCARQVPVAMSFGVVVPGDLQYAGSAAVATTKRRLPTVRDEANEIERAATVLRAHPDYAAPDAIVERIRELIDSGRYRLFDV